MLTHPRWRPELAYHSLQPSRFGGHCPRSCEERSALDGARTRSSGGSLYPRVRAVDVLTTKQQSPPLKPRCQSNELLTEIRSRSSGPDMSPKGAAIHQPRATPWDRSSRRSQALKGRNNPRTGLHRVSPLQGSRRSQSSIPRALPWAIESCPFGAEEPTQNLRLLNDAAGRPACTNGASVGRQCWSNMASAATSENVITTPSVRLSRVR